MRAVNVSNLLSTILWRLVPLFLFVSASSYVIGREIANPNRRMVKLLVAAGLVVIMMRFEMVYALYLFIILMPFPSGIALGSTNVVLMTIIPLLWAVRANSAQVPLFVRTKLDPFIVLYILAFVVSLFNVETAWGLDRSIRVIWRELSAIAFFYLIVRFVDDEKKLEIILKVAATAVALTALTGLLQLVSPRSSLGWISLRNPFDDAGELTRRVQGVRVNGAVASHSVLSDFGVIGLGYMILHFLRSRNIIPRLIWLGLASMTLVVNLATANRGAFITLCFGSVYALYVFRRYLNPTRAVLLLTGATVLFVSAEFFLDRYSYAVSVTDRIGATRFENGIPDNRHGAWIPAFQRSLDHIFIGHGPYYDTGYGLTKKAWPHNAYIFTFHTLGLLGVIAFLLMRYKLFMITLMHRLRETQYTFSGIVMGILHIQLIQHMMAVMRTDFQRGADYIYVYIVWMLCGLIVATGRILEKKREEVAAGRSRQMAG